MHTCRRHGLHGLGFVASTLAAVLSLFLAPAAAGQSLQTYRMGIDTDNSPATGCAFSLGGVAPGSVPGFELQVTVVVNVPTNGPDPSIVSAQVEQCVAGVFADPQPLEGFTISFDDGAVHPGSTVPSDTVGGPIPLSLVGGSRDVRLAFHALSADGAEDALVTRDGADGPPILALLANPIPALSPGGCAVLAAALAALGLLATRRRRWAAAVVLALALTGSGAVLAQVVLDDQVATDPDDDATAEDTRAEIVAASYSTPESELGLRLHLSNLDVYSQFLFLWRGQYVTTDPVSGQASATALHPFTWREHLALVYREQYSDFAIQSFASGRYFRVHPGTPPLVFDDAEDLESATGWVVFMVAKKGDPEPPQQSTSKPMAPSGGEGGLLALSPAVKVLATTYAAVIVQNQPGSSDLLGLRGACDTASPDCDLVIADCGQDLNLLLGLQFDLTVGPR